MSVAPYNWELDGPANGESGKGLADSIIELIGEREDISTICDLGCGNGYLAGRLSALGFKVTGVDVSTTGIELASQTYRDATFVEEVIDRDLSTRAGLGNFDLVISSDVIEHLYRPSDLLEAAAPLLRPGGEILLTTPYHGYLKNLAISVTGKMDDHFGVLIDGGHIKFFSEKTLSRLLEIHGFRVLKFKFYGRVPKLWKNMICLARREG